MNGTVVDPRLKKLTPVRCKHYHVSGRRCGQAVDRKIGFCKLHKGTGALAINCKECRSMMAAFTPLKGW